MSAINKRENIKQQLIRLLNTFKRDYMNTGSHTGLLDTCFADEESAVDLVCELGTKSCKDIMRKTCYVIFLLKHSVESPTKAISSDITSGKLNIWYVESLLWSLSKITPGKGKKYLIQNAHKVSFTMSVVGYSALHYLCTERYALHLKEKGTLDHVLLYLAPRYENEPRVMQMLDESRTRISLSAMYKYNGMVSSDKKLIRINEKDSNTGSPERLLSGYAWEYLNKAFTCLHQLAQDAERGSKRIYGTAKAAARDFRDSNKTYEKHEEPTDDPFMQLSNDVRSMAETLIVDDIYRQLEIKETLDGLDDPSDKQIARLKFQKYTVREIAHELRKPKSTIQNRLTKLNLPF